MFSPINKIANRISRTLTQTAKSVRCKAVITAAVAATAAGFTGSAYGAFSDVVSVNTTSIAGASSAVNGVKGAGIVDGFTSNHTYNLTYAGTDLAITKITTAGTSYTPAGIATSVVDRVLGANPNTDIIWERGTGSYNSSTLAMQGPQEPSLTAAFSGNNLLVGTDNLFSNKGNQDGNNSNIERLDMLFTGGISASAADAFAIFERGYSTQHDGFKIAAITQLTGGKPSNYGPLITVAAGTWGKSSPVGSQNYIVTRKNDSVGGDKFHPTANVNQPLGGVVIPTNGLVPTGTEIYGYSLFATDVTGSGTQLVDWTNSSFFPSATTESTGGLDPSGTVAVLYTSAIPEPSTAVLGLVGMGGLLARRNKRKTA